MIVSKSLILNFNAQVAYYSFVLVCLAASSIVVVIETENTRGDKG